MDRNFVKKGTDSDNVHQCSVLNLEHLEEYFEREVKPEDFLQSLHQVMTDYTLCAGGYTTDLKTVARNIDFLQSLYTAVHRSVL